MGYDRYYANRHKRSVTVYSAGPLVMLWVYFWKFCVIACVWFWPISVIWANDKTHSGIVYGAIANFVWILFFGAIYYSIKRRLLGDHDEQ